MRYILLFLLPALFPFVASAALTVVADLGGESAAPFYTGIQPQPVSPVAESGTPLHEADLLPVKTTAMRPGKVTRQALALPGMTPLFLVGDDPLSRQWLRQRAVHLNTLNATGWVVQVNDSEALQSLRAIAPTLTLLPISADDLARRLALTAYPLLITADGIEQ